MEIKYDIPIQVTEAQYNYLMQRFAGMVAGREADGKFYIKVWEMACADKVRQILLNNKRFTL